MTDPGPVTTGRPPAEVEGKTVRRLLPASLGGLAGLACALCCAIPALLAAGVLGGAGWAAFGQILPGIAVALAAATALAWWWARRRPTHAAGCSGGDCSCAAPSP